MGGINSYLLRRKLEKKNTLFQQKTNRFESSRIFLLFKLVCYNFHNIRKHCLCAYAASLFNGRKKTTNKKLFIYLKRSLNLVICKVVSIKILSPSPKSQFIYHTQSYILLGMFISITSISNSILIISQPTHPKTQKANREIINH